MLCHTIVEKRFKFNGFQKLVDGIQNYVFKQIVIFLKERRFWFKLCPTKLNNTLVYFINTFRLEKSIHSNYACRSPSRTIPTFCQEIYCMAYTKNSIW